MILSVIDSHKISTITIIIISIIPAVIMVIYIPCCHHHPMQKEGVIPQTLKWPVYQQSHSDIIDLLACRRPVLRNLFSLWLLCSLITKEINLHIFCLLLEEVTKLISNLGFFYRNRQTQSSCHTHLYHLNSCANSQTESSLHLHHSCHYKHLHAFGAEINN